MWELDEYLKKVVGNSSDYVPLELERRKALLELLRDKEGDEYVAFMGGLPTYQRDVLTDSDLAAWHGTQPWLGTQPEEAIVPEEQLAALTAAVPQEPPAGAGLSPRNKSGDDGREERSHSRSGSSLVSSTGSDSGTGVSSSTETDSELCDRATKLMLAV